MGGAQFGPVRVLRGILFLVLLLYPALTVAGQEQPILDPAKQKEIWDAEHVTFRLERHFGKGFTAAWAAGNRERLTGYFLERFMGAGLDGLAPEVRRSGRLRETLRGPGGGGTLSAGELAKRLVGPIARFGSVESTGFRVLKIHNTEPDSDLWETTILMKASGRTEGGGPMEYVLTADIHFRFPTPEAITSDSRIVASWTSVSDVERTGGEVLFKEITREAGLADLPLVDNWDLEPEKRREYRYQMAVEDFDRDGYLDIVVSGLEGRPLLLRSIKGERFVDVADKFGIKPSGEDGVEEYRNALVGWTDYNNDGWPDLFVGPRLYHNFQGKRFLEATARAAVYFDKVPMGVTTADYDGDGWLDLYLPYLKSDRLRDKRPKTPWVGDNESGAANMMWRNLGNGRFRNVSQMSGTGGGLQQTFATSAFYLDDDHLPDLYVANDFGTNVVLKNLGDNRFQDVTAGLEAGDYSTSMGVATGDLDNNGSTEIYIANMYSKMGRRIIDHVSRSDYPDGVFEQIQGSCAGNRMYSLNADGKKYRELADDAGVSHVGWAYAPVMSDLDGDGLLDLYATTGFMSYDPGEPDG